MSTQISIEYQKRHELQMTFIGNHNILYYFKNSGHGGKTNAKIMYGEIIASLFSLLVFLDPIPIHL